MKIYSINLVLTIFLLSVCFMALSQPDSTKRVRIYETWVKTISPPYSIRAVLYEIKDSSIVLSNSLLKNNYLNKNFSSVEIPVNQIDYIKIRKKNRILMSSTLGATCMFTLVMIVLRKENTDIPPEYTAVVLAFPAATLACVGGGLIGSIRFRFPINQDFTSYNYQKEKLTRYSILEEKYTPEDFVHPKFDYRRHIGLLFGPSIPFGNFADKSIDNENADFAKTGGTVTFNIEQGFNKHWGLAVSFFYNSYEIAKPNFEDFHVYQGFIAGPRFSAPLTSKLNFDLKPLLGIANMSIALGNSLTEEGKGLCISLGGALRYNFSNRWCAGFETDYSFSSLDFGNDVKKIQLMNLCLLVGYRF